MRYVPWTPLSSWPSVARQLRGETVRDLGWQKFAAPGIENGCSRRATETKHIASPEAISLGPLGLDNLQDRRISEMKILVFGHSGSSGGAENALRHLVGILVSRHEVHVVLPRLDMSEGTYYQSIGVACHSLPVGAAIPHFSSAMLQYARVDFQDISKSLGPMGFELAISNTIAILHGGVIAASLGIPHITYAHEFLVRDDLMPTAISGGRYLQLVEDLSSCVISCSKFVAEQFTETKRAILPVLEPFDFSLLSVARHVDAEAERVIQVIGTQSLRKNVHFAVTLIKALDLRGVSARLDIIGSENSGSGKLQRALHKRGIKHRLIPHVPDPYALNASERVISLICSGSEPYGLTIPESLRRGIPVVAAASGGPSETLPGDLLFDPDDLDRCARLIEKVFNDYGAHVSRAGEIYAELQARPSCCDIERQLDSTLAQPGAVCVAGAPGTLMEFMSGVGHVIKPPIALEVLTKNIAQVYGARGLAVDPGTVADLIKLEVEQPGAAVLRDIRAYDVIPYAMSSQMDDLYKYGMGLAIELASTYSDEGRLQMAAFILCALLEKRATAGRPLRILALGDGIASDTVRLAAAGLAIDYIDYDKSNMARIAELNIAAARAASKGEFNVRVIEQVDNKYDAVVCLEVIEHVPSPLEFADAISGYLEEDGLLFMSECFNGIEARWPTHLLSNEKFAGKLPLMLVKDFVLLGANKSPYGKPFVFRKRLSGEAIDMSGLLLDPAGMVYLLSNQADIGL